MLLVRKLLDMQIKITTIEKLESTPSPADKLFDVLINHNFKVTTSRNLFLLG